MHDPKNSPDKKEDTKKIQEASYIRKHSGVTLEEKNQYIQEQVTLIANELEDGKAEEILKIDLSGKTALCDFMIFASGGSSRQVQSLADRIYKALSQKGYGYHLPSGKGDTGWVLIDTGDVIVHIFQSETRKVYGLDRMWSGVARAETENE
jgi:ribosome-associated protein